MNAMCRLEGTTLTVEKKGVVYVVLGIVGKAKRTLFWNG